jgi:hypothetical protein
VVAPEQLALKGRFSKPLFAKTTFVALGIFFLTFPKNPLSLQPKNVLSSIFTNKINPNHGQEFTSKSKGAHDCLDSNQKHHI